ncbi:MAG: S8 family serine peptidase [Lentimicrobium sp.]
MKKFNESFIVKGIMGMILFFVLTGIPAKMSVAINHHGNTLARGERPPVNLSSVPDDAFETTIIRVKFDRSMENYLDNMAISINPDGTRSFGIGAIDLLNRQYGVVEIKKSFASALQNTKFAARHRAWEFHLWYDLIVPSGTNVRSMVADYSTENEIQFSEPVFKKQLIGADINALPAPASGNGNAGLNYVPNDPRYAEQWHYHNTGQQSGTPDADIDLPEAWDIIRGSSDVIVAVIDQGIEYTHSDLAANMWPGLGYNFVNNNSTLIPGDHGSHVGGTIAASTNNAVGVAGVAGGSGTGNGVRLMSCQVFIGTSGGGGFENAPIWAADNGAAISQNSWGYTSAGYYEQAVLDAIDYFNANGGGTVLNGGITIFAAGNNGSSGQYYPGCYSGCFAIAATGNQDLKAWYSNYDTWVDISAPGGETNTVTERGVLSCLTGNSYGFYQGTSMACPHASGVAALVISLAPGVLTSQEVRNILSSTTDNIDAVNPSYIGMLGTGRLNAYNALIATQEFLTLTARFTGTPTTICTGGSVTFTDISFASPTSWNWSFPGGTPSSYNGQNPPPVAYAAAGIYDVSLTVSDGITTDTETKTGYITVKELIADFSGTPTTVVIGNSVTFTDNSSCNPTGWDWSFPGGTPSSYIGQTPPAIAYSTLGTYDVSLTITKTGSTDTKTSTGYITVTPPIFNMTNGTITTCNGDFYDSGGSGASYANGENITETFYPSTPGAMIRFNFTTFNTESGYDYLYIYNGTDINAPLIGSFHGTNGPGIVTADNQSGALTFRFTSDGSVTPSGWEAVISCYQSVDPPVADFTASSTTPPINMAVAFTDLSLNMPTSWTWSFSPNTITYTGGTTANSRNPEVLFGMQGDYTVSLTATNAFGSDTETKTGYITVGPEGYNMTNGTITTCSGTFYDSGGGSGNYSNGENYTLTFLPATSGAMVRAAFTAFNTESNYDYLYVYNGTSTSAPLLGTYHGTTLPGVITANNTDGALTFKFTSDVSVTPAGWEATISCYSINVPPVAAFTASETSPVILSTVTFTDQSENIPTAWAWSFSPNTVTFVNGTSAASQNPQVQFTALGQYSVTLTATNDYGSDSEVRTNYINAVQVEYCIPAYTTGTGAGDYISLVQLGNINNATGASSSPYYTYYSDLTTDLTPGSTYTITLSPGTYSSGNFVAVWIDYNRNNVFDAAEKLGTISISPTPATGTIPFTVPADAVTGLTRMRVREVWNNSSFDACTTYSYGETEDYNVNILGTNRTLNLTVLLESLYNGNGTMRKAQGESGDQFSGNTADQVSIELHNASDYSIIEHTEPFVNVSTEGLASITIPGNRNGNYYITVKHRNSIETTSKEPIAFTSSLISYNFDGLTQAYGNNMLLMIDGHYAIFCGDVNQDGFVDTGDLTPVNNDAGNYATGYLVTDINGDGTVDTADITVVDNNAANYAAASTP